MAACGAPAAPPAADKPADPAAPAPEEKPAETGGEAAPAVEQGELNLLLCCSSAEDLENRAKWNANGSKNYPGVTVNQEAVPAGQNYFEKLQTLIAADTMPDLYDMWEGYIQPYAANGALAEPRSLLRGRRQSEEGRTRAGGRGRGRLAGQDVRLLPGLHARPGLALLQRGALRDGGRCSADYRTGHGTTCAPPPRRSPNRNEQWGLTYSLWFVPWLYWIWSNGGDLFNADQTACALTDPQVHRGVAVLGDMVLTDQTTLPSSEAQALQGPDNAFRTGKVSMYLGNCWDVPAHEAPLPRELASTGRRCSRPRPTTASASGTSTSGAGACGRRPRCPGRLAAIRDFILDQVNQAAQPMVPPMEKLFPVFDTPENKALGYEPLIDAGRPSRVC